MRRLRQLSGDQQRAGIAAAALLLTLFLPWYRISPQHDNLTAFEVFTFVEAAVLVVAAAVMYLLYARAHQRGFHLPGGDGWAITLAGAWVVFLLIWRLFDKPDAETGVVGVQWGIFVAMLVGAVLAAAGQRLRIARVPEPPNPAAEETWEEPRRRPPRRDARRRPVDPAAVTHVLRDERPSWQGEPPEPPPAPPPSSPPARDRTGASTRPLWDEPDPPTPRE